MTVLLNMLVLRFHPEAHCCSTSRSPRQGLGGGQGPSDWTEPSWHLEQRDAPVWVPERGRFHSQYILRSLLSEDSCAEGSGSIPHSATVKREENVTASGEFYGSRLERHFPLVALPLEVDAESGVHFQVKPSSERNWLTGKSTGATHSSAG